MKFRPYLFFPVAFALCMLMVSVYRYLSVPAFTDQDMEERNAIILKIDQDEIEAVSYARDTLMYIGPLPDQKPEAGKEIVLYKIKGNSKYVSPSRSHFDQLKKSKSRALWIALGSLVILIGSVYVLYTSKRKQNG